MANDDTRDRPHPVPAPPARVGKVSAPGAEVRQAERARFAARSEAEVTLDSIGDAVLRTDLSGHVTYLNVAAEALTGWSRAEAVGRPLDDVFHVVNRGTRDRAGDPTNLAVALNRPAGLTAHGILVRRDGREIEIEDSAAPIHNRDGQVTGAVMVCRDVGAALEMPREMSHPAQHDVLAGLPSRLLGDRLTEAVLRAHRCRRPLAVLILDIEGRQGLDDPPSHATRDALLPSVAARLAGVLRRSDTVCHCGDGRFAIVPSETERTEHAAPVGTTLTQPADRPHGAGARDVGVASSHGVSRQPDRRRGAARAGSGKIRLAARGGHRATHG